jgi:hypothetical protein
MGLDRPSSGDLESGQDQQGAQEVGGVAGVHADLGQDAPGLEVGEGVLVAARSRLISLFASFWASVRGRLRAAFFPVMMTGLSGSCRPTKPRSPIAPSPASLSFVVMWLWRAAVMSEARPGLAA